MKRIILIVSIAAFLISCEKKAEEQQTKKNKSIEKTSKDIKTKQKQPQKQLQKQSVEIVGKETTDNALSNALNFAKKIDLNTSAEEGNVEYMTIADAKRILDNSKELKMSFVEKIAGNCRDFNVVNYFMTNLCEKILSGKIKLEVKMPDYSALPPEYIKIVKQHESWLNNEKQETAAYILNELSIRSQIEKKYKYAVNISERLLEISDRQSMKTHYYDILATAYNCLHDFDNEAKAQKGAFDYFYEKRKSLPKEALKEPLRSYISSLCNAGEYDTAIKLVKKLNSEKRIDNYNELMEKLQDRDSQKSYRSF